MDLFKRASSDSSSKTRNRPTRLQSPRLFSTRELLPKEYAKAREHEKNIAEEYREIIYEDQMAPKKKYCELCQSLPTYGVTFFLVCLFVLLGCFFARQHSGSTRKKRNWSCAMEINVCRSKKKFTAKIA